MRMDAIECIKKRRSIRTYLDKPVPKEILSDIVDCGRMAATARNVQPIEFIVVTDQNMRERLAELCEHGKFFSECGAVVVVVSEDTKYYLEDGCAATQNVLNAARAYGLGSCWVAGDKKPYCDDIIELLGAKGFKLVSLVAVGYAENLETGIKKKELPIHWEKF